MPAIILAAGASRRLGQPKQLVPMDGETLLARTIRITIQAGAGPVLVVLGAHQQLIQPEVAQQDVTTVVNADWEKGIATSIHAGMRALAQVLPEAKAAMLLVCDQPKLNTAHLEALAATWVGAAESSIVASRYGGIAGIPVIFPASQFGSLMSLSGDTGARFLLRSPSIPLLTVDWGEGVVDIDTPEDLAAQA